VAYFYIEGRNDHKIKMASVRKSASARGARTTRRSKSPGVLPGEQPGLRGLTQSRLLNDVFQAASGTFLLLFPLFSLGVLISCAEEERTVFICRVRAFYVD